MSKLLFVIVFYFLIKIIILNTKGDIVMELVNLIYQYVNKFINSEELFNELNKIDISKYSDEDKKIINKLIDDIQNIRENIPNEIDDVEKNRLKQVDDLLNKIEIAKEQNLDNSDENLKNFLEKQYNNLLDEKNKIKDGGRLYNDIVSILTNNSIVNRSASNMDNKQLLSFITKYIKAPKPPIIDQENFNDLVNAGIEDDKRKALWRLAVNYNNKMDFTLIEDYFIKKRDAYYLIELISATDNIDLDKLVDRVVATCDRTFMNDLANRALELGIFTKDDIIRIKNKYNL